MGTCKICRSVVARVGPINTTSGTVNICALCAMKPCAVCGREINRMTASAVYEVSYAFRTADGETKEVEGRVRVHAGMNDTCHRDFYANPGRFICNRREATEASKATQQPITHAAPRLVVVREQQTVAP